MKRLAPGTEYGQYHILRHIGGGGMAQIYLAKTRGLAGFEKYLALKVINEEYANEERFVQMLINEAKIAVGLSHVNIAQVFDLGQVGNIYYIAMEFVDGVDILRLVNGLHGLGKRLDPSAVAFIARQMCSGLHYAHTRKDSAGNPLDIVHRDISPQNVLVSRNGEVKLVDFGIAKAAGVGLRTQAGVIKGKVNYMAPEQAAGRRADRRSDLFSTGIVMWEMLTAEMLYSGNDVAALVLDVREANISPPSSVRKGLPRELDAIVMKALAKAPEDRYQTAHELQVDLTRFLSATAGEYSAADMAEVVEQVIQEEDQGPRVPSHVSREDVDSLGYRDSVIFSVDEPPAARLTMVTQKGRRTIDLGSKELLIGRMGHLRVPDVRVSRHHARIIREGAAYLLEDLRSANGTFLNSEPLGPTARPLVDGDEIRVGSTRMKFAIIGPSPRLPARAEGLRLVAVCAGQRLETALTQEVPLGYRLRIGTTSIEGNCGRIFRKADECWIEPQPGRVAVIFHGEPLAQLTRLAAGDSFSIGQVQFRVAAEPGGAGEPT